MITVLLTVLKIIGIILLCVLLALLCVLLVVLFVPVRYRIHAARSEGEKTPVRVSITVTWLLHILNAAFCYPKENGLRVRIFCFTIFPARKKTKPKKDKKSFPEEKEKTPAQEEPDSCPELEEPPKKPKEPEVMAERKNVQGQPDETQHESPKGHKRIHKVQNLVRKIREFAHKLIGILKNIKYTIQKICDKIKTVVKNIQYYMEIIQSDTFKRTWRVCGGEALKLLCRIRPSKVRGSLVVGTGDPASTAQIIGIHGILYPLIGDHITVIPDFERAVVEGELFIRGKITLFRALKTAIIIYFNKDLRKVIRLLKKEAA